MQHLDELEALLRRIDGRGYKAYKGIKGVYTRDALELCVDYVQGDPFASPSKVRLWISHEEARLPEHLWENEIRATALEDVLARCVRRGLERRGRSQKGSGKSGQIFVDAGRQEVLARTAVLVGDAGVEVRLQVGLPAAGRKVMGHQAARLLCEELPKLAIQGLCWAHLPQEAVVEFVDCVENQESIRAQLRERGLLCFVANGAILPRESGASDRPLDARDAVAFQSPASLEVSVQLLHPIPDPQGTGSRGSIEGMGIPEGVSLIVGGGYHGKSTLLQAIERGVYPHVPGDGREYVVTCHDAVKIRAEDGRRVEGVDISGLIGELPRGRSTAAFSSEDASGSTSQAANIVEAIEVGARLLLLDEDTSATNFMVRDARMQALIHKEHEPITPFLDRVRELYEVYGVSSILVMGGCGDYFDVADRVIAMEGYLPEDVTQRAREIAAQLPSRRQEEVPCGLSPVRERVPVADSFDASRGRRDVKIDAKGLDLLLYGEEAIELRGVEQLVDISQTRAIGAAIYLASTRLMDGVLPLGQLLDALEALFDDEGLDILDPFHREGEHPGNFARPRRYEIAAAINRLRTVQMN